MKKKLHTEFMTITINCLAPEHYSLLIRLKQTGLLKIKPLEKIIKAGKNTIKTTLNSIDGIRIRKDYFNEQNTLFRRIWFNKKGLPAFDSAKK